VRQVPVRERDQVGAADRLHAEGLPARGRIVGGRTTSGRPGFQAPPAPREGRRPGFRISLGVPSARGHARPDLAAQPSPRLASSAVPYEAPALRDPPVASVGSGGPRGLRPRGLGHTRLTWGSSSTSRAARWPGDMSLVRRPRNRGRYMRRHARDP
jgi:hypothetical protein